MAVAVRGHGGVGLVLGGGGFVGGAWLVGALQGVAHALDWDPASADRVVGTSAGAMIGALIAGGLPPDEVAAYAHGAVAGDGPGAAAADPYQLEMMALQLHRAVPLPLPGSPRLALATMRDPGGYSPMARLAGWLPRGVVSTEPLRATVRRLVPEGWAPGNRLWVVACDYATGAATVFGRGDAEPADLADAVAASCAIPGFYHPVTIGDRCYIDGGVRSPSNLDLVCGAGLRTVICLNPTSSRAQLEGGGVTRRLASRIRRVSRDCLDREAAIVAASGTRVIVLEPSRADLATMGTNLMRRDNLKSVIAQARQSVRRQLRRLARDEARDLLAA